MNCPHCQQELVTDVETDNCPFCHQRLSNGFIADAQTTKQPGGLRWFWFFLAMLLPPILTLLSAISMLSIHSGHAANEGVSFVVGLLGGLLGGLCAGILLACKISRTIGIRILLSLVFIPVFAVVCVMLCLMGCSVGGYQFQLR